ncbi:MAG: DUF1080 domain-containing protein [Emcibacteraceae bacterium]
MLKKLCLLILSTQFISNGPSTVTYAADNELSAQEKAAGWQLLFDGKDINAHWRGYRMKDAPTKWIIDDNAIYFNPEANGTNGDLISREIYDQFEFSLQWKVAPGSNSGIFFNIVEDDAYQFPYETAPEMQVLDNDGHPDGKFKQHRAGDLYDLMESRVENVHPVGEWNDVLIRVMGNNVQFYQNGDLVIDTTMWDDNWAALIADSKFATWPGFGKSKSGYLGLQDHTEPVWFKNLKVKKLD